VAIGLIGGAPKPSRNQAQTQEQHQERRQEQVQEHNQTHADAISADQTSINMDIDGRSSHTDESSSEDR
jgi:hypothetical protein